MPSSERQFEEQRVSKAARVDCTAQKASNVANVAKVDSAEAHKIAQQVKVDGPGDCVRLRGGGVVLRRRQSQDVLEVLLVTRRRAANSHTLPAGKFEEKLDEGSFQACALRETNEESGINGDIIFDLGWYLGHARKTNDETRTRFFAIHFTSEETSWQEDSERQRRWHTLEEAIKLVTWNPVLVEVLEHFKAEFLSKAHTKLSLLAERSTCAQELDCGETKEVVSCTPTTVTV